MGGAKGERGEVTLEFALVDIGAREFSRGKQRDEFEGKAAVGFVVGVGNGDGGEFAGIEAGLPSEAGARGGDALGGGEGDGAGAGRHSEGAGFGGWDGADLACGFCACGEAEGTEKGEERVGVASGSLGC